MTFIKRLFLSRDCKGLILHLKSLEYEYGNRFKTLSKPIEKYILNNQNEVKKHFKTYDTYKSLISFYIVRMSHSYISTGNYNHFQGLLNDEGGYLKSHFDSSLDYLRNSGSISEELYNEWNEKLNKRINIVG